LDLLVQDTLGGNVPFTELKNGIEVCVFNRGRLQRQVQLLIMIRAEVLVADHYKRIPGKFPDWNIQPENS
jgi:hypothetical protein